jgi:hypothetical protein
MEVSHSSKTTATTNRTPSGNDGGKIVTPMGKQQSFARASKHRHRRITLIRGEGEFPVFQTHIPGRHYLTDAGEIPYLVTRKGLPKQCEAALLRAASLRLAFRFGEGLSSPLRASKNAH